jgi:hypothetical protein
VRTSALLVAGIAADDRGTSSRSGKSALLNVEVRLDAVGPPRPVRSQRRELRRRGRGLLLQLHILGLRLLHPSSAVPPAPFAVQQLRLGIRRLPGRKNMISSSTGASRGGEQVDVSVPGGTGLWCSAPAATGQCPAASTGAACRRGSSQARHEEVFTVTPDGTLPWTTSVFNSYLSGTPVGSLVSTGGA